MNPFRSRQIVLVLVALAVGAGGLLAPAPALADLALFRVQRTFLGAPFPGITLTAMGNKATSHAVGRDEEFLRPPKPFASSITSKGTLMLTPGTTTYVPPGTAKVQAGNMIGAKFTLPNGFINTQFTTTAFPSTAFTGYLSQTIATYVNGEARFLPNNPNGAAAPTTVSFLDNYTAGTTTTHGGLFDFARNGYMKIEPGTNNFGGTMRILYDPNSFFYQYISYFNPLFFKAYGVFKCTKGGVACTDGLETTVGEVTSSGSAFRHLLSPTQFTYATPTTMGKTKYRKLASPGATSKAYYLHLQAPWTTGKITVFNTVGKTSGYGAKPRTQGYDKSLGGANLKITRTVTSVSYMGQGNTSYPTQKYYTHLTGVTRVVSLVHPRITNTYLIPRIVTDPITNNYQANRAQVMRVFFLPEPAGMLMLGAGIAVLLGLSRIRWR